MTILQAIVAWVASQKPWMQDAVRRLIMTGSLDQKDLDDLLALLRAEHGIPDDQGRIPVPANVNQIPQRSPAGTLVTLLAIRDLERVNAIAGGQRLAISPKGLTVIYGDNGSGKSGYSRVLKKACRARDRLEEILPNANLSVGVKVPASATFEIDVSGATRDVLWVDGEPSPAELSSLAIFDKRCERSYLDEEDDFSYVPYGLDVLQELAKVCAELKSRVVKEEELASPDLTPFVDLIGQTAVGMLISHLSHATVESDVQNLGTVSRVERERHEQISRSLQESDPGKAAAGLRLAAKRAQRVAANSASISDVLGERSISRLKIFQADWVSSKLASDRAAEALQKAGALLPGTGGAAWKFLFAAARAFAAEAHPGDQFAASEHDARCPLCQQPLGPAAERMAAFEQFVQSEAQTLERAAKDSFNLTREEFLSRRVTLGLADEDLKEFDAFDSGLASELLAFDRAATDRQLSAKFALDSGDWTGVSDLPLTVPGRLALLIERLNSEAQTLELLATAAERPALEAELAELRARIALDPRKPAVLAAIAKMRRREKLAACEAALNTRGITNKVDELSKQAVSKELELALNKELKALGVSQLSVTLETRLVKGRTLHSLKLNLLQARSLNAILSEGEQRAIALASFLAEVGLGGSMGGIVFDDPVSSLDHQRREVVAARLVEESKQRQVIILTHDIYFVCVLVEHASRNAVPLVTQSLARQSEGFGVPEQELPFEARAAKARIASLRNDHQRISKLEKEGNEQARRKETVDAYRALRYTWERAVEEVLLQGAVLRFRKGVETNRLSAVEVTDDDFKAIEAGVSRCSNFAHDGAALGSASVPQPGELLADIDAIETWRKSVDTRSKVTRGRRVP